MKHVKIKEGLISAYYSRDNFTKGKVYTTTYYDGIEGVWCNNGNVHISLSQFDEVTIKKICGGELL